MDRDSRRFGIAQSAFMTLSLMLCIAGCQSSPNPITDSPIIVIETLDSSQPLRAVVMYHPEARVTRYHVTGGDHSGAILSRETFSSDKYNSQWMTVESIIENNGPTVRSAKFWSIDDQGDLLLHASIDHEEDALTLFKPPLVVAPKILDPNDNSETETPLRVVSDSNPAQKKESGDAKQTISHNGMVRIRTALGELDAMKILIDFEADMSVANATEKTELYVNEDHGIVAEKRTRKIKIFGLGGSTLEELLTIASDK